MTNDFQRLPSGSDVLRNKVVRIPLPDVAAERTCYENIQRIAGAVERKIELLADPDVPVTQVYENELAEIQWNFEHRIQQLTGEGYYEVATAYLDGEREETTSR